MSISLVVIEIATNPALRPFQRSMRNGKNPPLGKPLERCIFSLPPLARVERGAPLPPTRRPPSFSAKQGARV